MKALRTLLSVAVLGTLIAFSGCGGGGGNTEPVADQQLGKLKKSWVLKNATDNGQSVLYGSGVNQVDSTKNWKNFVLTITGTTGQTTFSYTTTGRPTRSVWKSGDSWQFGTDPKTQIVRGDGVQITYSLDASNNLQLQFTYTGAGYTTRSSNVSGDWTFNLIPQ